MQSINTSVGNQSINVNIIDEQRESGNHISLPSKILWIISFNLKCFCELIEILMKNYVYLLIFILGINNSTE